MSLRRIASLAAATLVATVLMPSQAATAADPEPSDGRFDYTAAASCWEIKQSFPGSGDGTYWIQTAAMPAPQQVYCDQTTDGGGWALIARGRDQWTESGGGTFGSGSWTTTLPVDGSGGAMVAKQFSGTTIDALLNRGRVDALSDGVRLRRALNTSGTKWQESRIKFAKRDRWSWAFAARHPVSVYSVAGLSAKNVSTDDLFIGKRDDETSVMTLETAANGYVRGFSYGAKGPQGSSAADSYLYSQKSNGVNSTPFTQMYVRPKLSSSSMRYSSIPDAGLPASANRPIVDSRSLPGRWGVSGLGNGGYDKDYATEVSAFHQIGGVMYVGGNFTTVLTDPSGANPQTVDQPYLAAFDAGTGEWISSFRPQLNNQVKALTSYNGRLLVGGQFTSVNGVTRRALVALDARTGATYEPFRTDFAQSSKSDPLWVRALDITGDQLYVGGGFTSVRGGGATSTTELHNVARMSASSGAVDTAFRPNLGTGAKLSKSKRAWAATIFDLDLADDGKTLYAAGKFVQGYMGAEGRKAVTATGAAAISTDSRGTLKSWKPTYSTTTVQSKYQQAVKQVGSRIWLGGSQHSMVEYDASSLKFKRGNITINGGDFQAIAAGGGVVYGSCHCEQWNYSNTMGWKDRKLSGFTQADRIGFVGAWDASTGDYLPEFAPSAKTRSGEGPWALETAADGTLWSGGDYTRTTTTNNQREWAGGFVRYPRKDATSPPAPSDLQIYRKDGSDYAYLGWRASSESGVSYELLMDDRVVQVISPGSVYSKTQNYGLSSRGHRFFVRAVDAAGNRSATTPALVVPARASAARLAPQSQPTPTDEPTPTEEPTESSPTQPAPTETTPTHGASAESTERAPTDPAPDEPERTGDVISPGASWKLSTGPQQEASWASSPEAPSGWRTVTAPVGLGNDLAATRLTRTDTVYLRHDFTVDDPSAVGTVTIHTVADDGAAIYLNGVEVGRKNLPDGALSSGVTATARPYGSDSLSWTIEVPVELLRTGRNVVGAEIHAAGPDTQDLGFELQLAVD